MLSFYGIAGSIQKSDKLKTISGRTANGAVGRKEPGSVPEKRPKHSPLIRQIGRRIVGISRINAGTVISTICHNRLGFSLN
jgi:hypothetical protein